ncbi:unnamed protein product [Paramecium sonneborni]|uniref:protein-tyrosine-phosphatase n=1 Tax=Paramecium sonneborni TaxID=65129 RepID=A0A8S1KXD3_9CILI|nr:unnamed protein product [Paramecium sonneborni]
MLQQRPPFPSGVMDCILPKSQELGALFLSGLEAAINPYLLQQNQIGAILTVGSEMANLQFQDANHKILYLNDTSHDPIKKYFDESIQFIQENRQRCNVLVHCYVGVSRSATIIIAYLMQICNFPLQKSLQHLQQVRPLINPNPGFMQQLQNFDQELLIKRLSQIRPPSVEIQRPISVHGYRREQISSHRSTGLPQSPLRKVNGPSQVNPRPLMMTPMSIRKMENNQFRQGTPLKLKENFCKSLNSSINSNDFRKILQSCNQYHSAKKSTNDGNLIKQAAIFCKTYSNNQNQLSQVNLLLKTSGSGLGSHHCKSKGPLKIKGSVVQEQY